MPPPDGGASLRRRLPRHRCAHAARFFAVSADSVAIAVFSGCSVEIDRARGTDSPAHRSASGLRRTGRGIAATGRIPWIDSFGPPPLGGRVANEERHPQGLAPRIHDGREEFRARFWIFQDYVYEDTGVFPLERLKGMGGYPNSHHTNPTRERGNWPGPGGLARASGWCGVCRCRTLLHSSVDCSDSFGKPHSWDNQQKHTKRSILSNIGSCLRSTPC